MGRWASPPLTSSVICKQSLHPCKAKLQPNREGAAYTSIWSGTSPFLCLWQRDHTLDGSQTTCLNRHQTTRLCSKETAKVATKFAQSYDVKICYKPGKEIFLADTLSRAYLPTSERQKSETEEEVETIHMQNRPFLDVFIHTSQLETS